MQTWEKFDNKGFPVISQDEDSNLDNIITSQGPTSHEKKKVVKVAKYSLVNLEGGSKVLTCPYIIRKTEKKYNNN